MPLHQPEWLPEVAELEGWGDDEWSRWDGLARRFRELRVAVKRTPRGPFADGGAEAIPVMFIALHGEERPWLEALDRLCDAVVTVRRRQGWNV